MKLRLLNDYINWSNVKFARPSFSLENGSGPFPEIIVHFIDGAFTKYIFSPKCESYDLAAQEAVNILDKAIAEME